MRSANSHSNLEAVIKRVDEDNKNLRNLLTSKDQ